MFVCKAFFNWWIFLVIVDPRNRKTVFLFILTSSSNNLIHLIKHKMTKICLLFSRDIHHCEIMWTWHPRIESGEKKEEPFPSYQNNPFLIPKPSLIFRGWNISRRLREFIPIYIFGIQHRIPFSNFWPFETG